MHDWGEGVCLTGGEVATLNGEVWHSIARLGWGLALATSPGKGYLSFGSSLLQTSWEVLALSSLNSLPSPFVTSLKAFTGG